MYLAYIKYKLADVHKLYTNDRSADGSHEKCAAKALINQICLTNYASVPCVFGCLIAHFTASFLFISLIHSLQSTENYQKPFHIKYSGISENSYAHQGSYEHLIENKIYIVKYYPFIITYYFFL